MFIYIHLDFKDTYIVCVLYIYYIHKYMKTPNHPTTKHATIVTNLQVIRHILSKQLIFLRKHC